MTVLLRVAFLMLAIFPIAAQGQTIWKPSTEYPATAMPGEGLKTFAREVAARSKELIVEPSFDAAAGIKSAGMLQAVRDGVLPAGDAFAGALGGVDPIYLLSSLPFVTRDLDDAERLYRLARPVYEAHLAKLGQTLLYATPWPATGLWSKAPVRSAADLKGLALRSYDATSTAVMNAAGAKAMNLSFADAGPKLADGTLQALLSSGDGGAGRKLWEHLPFFAEITYALPLSLTTANLKALEALPPEARTAVRQAAEATEQAQWALVRTRLAENYARMRANGMTIDASVPADLTQALRAAAAGAIEEWKVKAGPEGAGLLEKFLKKP